MLKTKVALAANRTPVSRVAAENSTTEPPMLVTSSIFLAQSHIKYWIHVKNKICIGGESHPGLPLGRQEFYHYKPPMLVTTTIFPAQSHIKYFIQVKNKSSIGWDSNHGLPRGRREFYH